MIAASTFAPEHIVRLLIRLNRGEAVSFSHEPGGPLAFTIARNECGSACNFDPLSRGIGVQS